jgi:hypothetical protein
MGQKGKEILDLAIHFIVPSFYTYKYGRHSVNDNNVTAIANMMAI